MVYPEKFWLLHNIVMHIHTLDGWHHSHNFLPSHHRAERNTKIVMGLSAITMLAEIIAGMIFGSIALLADGWHMATHVAAFGVAVFAYQYARNHANNPQYTFGTGKVSVLAGFGSAVGLAVIALVMALESIGRFFQPQAIQFNEAIGVALIGLIVNLGSAALLNDHHADHPHDHHPDHHHNHHPDHHPDQNLRAAYLHVLADALTSVLAIAALVAGKFLGWIWMDAAMGLVGAVVIAKWAYGLVRDTGTILLDGSIDKSIKLAIVTAIESDADNRVTDLHVWQVGENCLSVILSLVTHHPQPPNYYKQLLKQLPSIAHIVVEVHPCQNEACLDLVGD